MPNCCRYLAWQSCLVVDGAKAHASLLMGCSADRCGSCGQKRTLEMARRNNHSSARATRNRGRRRARNSRTELTSELPWRSGQTPPLAIWSLRAQQRESGQQGERQGNFLIPNCLFSQKEFFAWYAAPAPMGLFTRSNSIPIGAAIGLTRIADAPIVLARIRKFPVPRALPLKGDASARDRIGNPKGR